MRTVIERQELANGAAEGQNSSECCGRRDLRMKLSAPVGRVQMRASFLLVSGVVLALATPAFADPAYTANKIVDYFHTAKAAKLGNSRKICFEGDPDCAAAAAPKPFDLMVNFEFDSDRLTSAAKENLGQFATALHDPQLRKEKFAIDGYTDATGAEIYNRSLSERRA